MVTIIDSKTDFDILVGRIEHEECFVLPILANQLVSPQTNLIGLYVHFFGDTHTYISLLDHSEALYSSDLALIAFNNDNVKYVIDKKEFMHLYPSAINVVDLRMVAYVNSIKFNLPRNTTYAHYEYLYKGFKSINSLVPITRLIGYGSSILDEITRLNLKNLPVNPFYNEDTISVFQQIEKSGLRVDKDIFKAHFKVPSSCIINQLTYTNYNLYTTIGRPSNANNGINYAALKKGDNCRTSFISRFCGGRLVEFDFQAYHPSLIAAYMGYELPTDMSIYEYLAQYYFPDEPITPAIIKQSKQITFEQLYGGISAECKHIKFFQMAGDMLESIFQEYERQGYLESPISGRRLIIPGFSKNKLFNYFFQLQETERNVAVLKDLFPLLEGKRTKIILYTYDAILFDMPADELADEELIKNIRKIMEFPQFTVKMKIGISYKELI